VRVVEREYLTYEMSFEEIAATMGLTRQGVERLYHRAVEKLRYRLPRPEVETVRFIPPSKTTVGGWAGGAAGEPETELRDYSLLWCPRTTRVVSGPYGKANFPGTRFPTRGAAREYWAARTRILEEHKIKGRYIFRIPK
jgi:hypothetical protein